MRARRPRLTAPFRKIVVTVRDATSFSRSHGRVVNVLGVCEVDQAVEMKALAQKATDHGWVLNVVGRAVDDLEQSVGWKSDELGSFIKRASQSPAPLVHYFDALARHDRKLGIDCVPWLSTRPEETCIGVRIGARDVAVFSKPGPVYMEDEFPLAKAVLRGRAYVLLDRTGSVLASVGIDEGAKR